MYVLVGGEGVQGECQWWIVLAVDVGLGVSVGVWESHEMVVLVVAVVVVVRWSAGVRGVVEDDLQFRQVAVWVQVLSGRRAPAASPVTPVPPGARVHSLREVQGLPEDNHR